MWTSWIIKAEKFALGPLNLRPDQFWRLTPNEFNAMALGYYSRVKAQRRESAYWVATLVNHFPMHGRGAKALRVEDMVGLSDEQIKQLERKRKQVRAQADARRQDKS